VSTVTNSGGGGSIGFNNTTTLNDSKGVSVATSKKAYTMSTSVVRPSIAFVSMNREQQKMTTYVDLYDGPSSLQKRDQVPTMKESSVA